MIFEPRFPSIPIGLFTDPVETTMHQCKEITGNK